MPQILRLLIFIAVIAMIASFGASTMAADGFKAKDCSVGEQKLSDMKKAELLKEHLAHDLSSGGSALVRRAYVMEYDASRRLPRWAAWRAKKSFLDPPDRNTHRWDVFHLDPDVPDPVGKDEYENSGFDRGHIVPHYISGGDRDGDGIDAECSKEDRALGRDQECETVENRPVQDPYDACTVFEVNYMSNVVPQLSTFNRSGLWYKLETIIRDAIDRQGKEFNVIAGPVFSVGDAIRKIGPHSDIHVPHSFFKIVIHQGKPLAFLFSHDKQADGPGCSLESALRNCVVSVDKIESATGLGFFNELRNEKQHDIEAVANVDLWRKLQKWAN